MAHRSSNVHPARRTEPDDAASADGAVDPYDPAYIFRSIFGSKMKGHRQVWPDIHLDELKRINPELRCSAVKFTRSPSSIKN